MKTSKIEGTPYGSALRAVRMHADALTTLKAELDRSYTSGTTAQRTELRTRIANLETEVAFRQAEVRRLQGPDNQAARTNGRKLIEARNLQSNIERASRGLAPLEYEVRG